MPPAKPKEPAAQPAAELTDANVPNSGNDPSAKRVDDPAAKPNPPQTDEADSLGNSKEAKRDPKLGTEEKPEKVAPVGPRGVNVPRDVKPAPSKSVKLKDVSDVTDKADSAGNVKHAGDDFPHPPIGPRGPEAARFIRESYKVDKHR